VFVDVREPRLGVGIVGSVLLHGALIAAFIVLRPAAPPPAPPLFRVQLVAAPRAEPAISVPQPQPAAAPVKTVPPPITKKVPPRHLPPVKAKPAPSSAPVSETPSPAKAEPVAPQPVASSAGGRGADVANLVTAGIEFPYPGYIQNIANQLIRQFNAIHTGRGALVAEVGFTIRRDGTVPLESIRLVTSSGVYTFNQDALAAVEAAANAKVFGPLPAGFREDILPVHFRFEPAALR